MQRRLIPLLIVGPLIAVTTACSPAQVEKWLEWHAQDPVAAEEWARNDCGALCTDDTDHDGVVEPDAPRQSNAPTADRTGQGGDVWDNLAWCESGGNWGYNGGSGYDGGLQFLPATWRAYGGREFAEYAWQASRSQQIIVAERVLDDVGWGAWPACSRKLGLR